MVFCSAMSTSVSAPLQRQSSSLVIMHSRASSRKMRGVPEDFEIVPSPADFIPEEPGRDYTVDGTRVHSLRMKNVIKEMFSNIMWSTAAFLLIGISLLFTEARNDAIKENKSDDYLPSFMYNVYSKLEQQYNEVKEENQLLKSEFSELVRWRNEQSQQLQTTIENAIEKYDSDKIGLIDFALETTGGYITSTPNTLPYEINVNRFIGFINVKERSNPQSLLQPGVLPGQCFAFVGNRGRIRIKLMRKIVITSVTLEHVHRNLVVDDGLSAPKEFRVIGLKDERDQSGTVLGSFVYEINGKALQTFELPDIGVKANYGHVELHVLSNYGHAEYTCVYRFRVHGIPAS